LMSVSFEKLLWTLFVLSHLTLVFLTSVFLQHLFSLCQLSLCHCCFAFDQLLKTSRLAVTLSPTRVSLFVFVPVLSCMDRLSYFLKNDQQNNMCLRKWVIYI
jgi:hypothetical protein